MSDIRDRVAVDGPARDADPDVGADLRRTAAAVALADRLLAEHPSASPAMVQHSIDDAIAAFRDARVQLFLPILIERAASASLAAAAAATTGAGSGRSDGRPAR